MAPGGQGRVVCLPPLVTCDPDDSDIPHLEKRAGNEEGQSARQTKEPVRDDWNTEQEVTKWARLRRSQARVWQASLTPAGLNHESFLSYSQGEPGLAPRSWPLA